VEGFEVMRGYFVNLKFLYHFLLAFKSNMSGLTGIVRTLGTNLFAWKWEKVYY
jgi:hypothetical protein